MRFGLIDLLFVMACIAIGGIAAQQVTSRLLQVDNTLIRIGGGIGLYLLLIYPFYRFLRMFPMVLPRCPCCCQSQPFFEVQDRGFPRITFRCPACGGQFVVWCNGYPGVDETWETPVLALKWPYAFGVYRQLDKPEALRAAKSPTVP